MEQKFRIFKENGRIVLLIEDASEKDIDIVKNIIGEVMMQDVKGIKANPVPTYDAPAQLAKLRSLFLGLPAIKSNDNSENESELKFENDNKYEPIVISKGKYANKTLRDIMAVNPSYVKWMVDKNHEEFRWLDFYKALDVYAEKVKTCSLKELEFIAMTLDCQPDHSNSVLLAISNALGGIKITDLQNENDVKFARETLEGYINELIRKEE